MAVYYPIGAAARLTGLSADTLRAWERRHRAVVPQRFDRGRAYSQSQLDRLQQLAALTASGHAIGSIAALSNAALLKLAAPAATRGGEPAAGAIDLLPLRRAVARYDLPGVEAILTRHALLLRPDALIFGVILPVLRDLGARWQAGAISPAHEHLVSCVIRTTLGGLLRSLPRPLARSRIVMAGPSGERHELGLLCAAVLATAEGHDVVYLGPDLPAADVVRAVAATKAAAVVLAATTPRLESKRDDAALCRLGGRARIWLGGAAAGALAAAIGPRAIVLASLNDLHQRLRARG